MNISVYKNNKYNDSNDDLQIELTHFTEWCNKWQLTISESKCKQLFINKNSNNTPAPITVNQHKLTPITSASPSTYPNVTQPCVRILGLYVDHTLTWKAHKQYVYAKANQRLSQLKCIVFNNKWQWKPMSIFRLYKSTIEPIITTNIIIYSTAIRNNDQILQIWRKGLQLSTAMRSKTSYLKLMKLTNAKSIPNIIDLKLTQFYLKCQLAPSNTFAGQNWIQYWRMVHQYHITTQEQSILKHLPLYRAQITSTAIEEYIRNQPNDTSIPIKIHPFEQFMGNIKLSGYGILPKTDQECMVRRPPPAYRHHYPNNLNNDINILNTLITNVYTDGSTDGNPGRSTFAWISKTYQLSLIGKLSKEYTETIPFPCSINIAELAAIHSVIYNIYDLYCQEKLPQNALYTIHTDSQACVNMFYTEYYPVIKEYYDMIQEIYELMNEMAQGLISFHICKVRAHTKKDQSQTSHERRNNYVDYLARQACKEFTDPLNAEMATYEYYFDNNNNYINAYYNRMYQIMGNNHQNTISDHNLLLQLPNTNHMMNEMRYLSYQDSRIINQIRCGYTTLPTDPPWINHYNCGCPGTPQFTVQHRLLECQLPAYTEARKDIRSQLIELNSEFSKDDYFNNLNNLLFPHLHYKSKELKQFENIINRVNILMIMAQYCRYRFPD